MSSPENYLKNRITNKKIIKFNINFSEWLLPVIYVEYFNKKKKILSTLINILFAIIYYQPIKIRNRIRGTINKAKYYDFIFIFDKDINDLRHSVDIKEIIDRVKDYTKNVLVFSSFKSTVEYCKTIGFDIYKLKKPTIKDFIFKKVIKLQLEDIKYYQHIFHQSFYVDQVIDDITNINTQKIVFIQDFLLTDYTFYKLFTTFHSNIKTITLQHGIITPYDNKYLGLFYFIFSEYFCVWGQKEVDLYKKHNFKTKVIPIGSVKFRYKKIRSNNDCKNILILLPGGFEGEFLLDILEFFQNYDYKLLVKPHPANNMKKIDRLVRGYKNLNIDIIDSIKKIDRVNFAIGFNSSIALDIFAMGIPFVNYRNNSQPQKNHSDYTIINIDSGELNSVFDILDKDRDSVLIKQNEKFRYEVYSDSPGENFCKYFCKENSEA